MSNILDKIEKLCYSDGNLKESFYWKKKLLKCFEKYYVDDLTDLNSSTCLTYLVTLSEINESLFSREVDLLLESSDLYFLEILISNQKPLITFHFWKYLKKEDGIDKGFLVSDVPYLKEHDLIYKKMFDFINNNKLFFINDNDLKSKVFLEGRLVSLYYKFFNQEGEDPLKVSY
ncbi:hypothetical protein [Tissierella praeacuta]|uniref:hypothetical protein n=1 Tax=Tissierella praeacuta TaxID=43131 RepID=UPI001C102E21|nr:hypothetical protein [Tissierella praeacuta]MBU5255278.1 hypothetical protein [Tissierella praeacuta]